MDFHVGVMAHAVPDPPGIAFPAVEVITVKQSVLVADGLLQGQADSAMGAGDNLAVFLFHDEGLVLSFLIHRKDAKDARKGREEPFATIASLR
jgi:hypothetical protein